MSESKFTPGPWVPETNQWGETSVKSANESDIAEWPVEYFIAEKVGGHVRGEDFTDFSEVHANAKLIAAAPDLMELANRVIEEFKNYERIGEICPFEGQPMIYASVLVELAEFAKIVRAKATA